MRRSIIRRLRDERGFSLVFALLTTLVTSVTLTSVIQYTTSNSSASNHSEADQIAYSLAEAGLNNGAAVLSNPSNNALDQATLPSTEPCGTGVLPCVSSYAKVYEGGTSKWWGVLTGHVWIMHGVGYVTDPTGRTATVRREATSTIKIQPTLKQTLNNNAFNYMFAKQTSAACDVTFANSIIVETSLFILGDLCFTNSSSIAKAAAPNVTGLIVGQHVHFGGTGSIAASTAKIAEAHIAGGCRVGGVSPGTSGETWTSPCTSGTRVWADTLDNSTVPGNAPVADFNFWYSNAKPGPTQFCSTGYSSGTSSTAFEAAGSTTMSAQAGPYSVPAFNLTPSSDYTCRYYDIPPAQNDLLGELSWKASTRTLTVKGVIFIDGSAYVSNNAVNTYVGLATLYLSGTFSVGQAMLCAAVAAGTCDFNTWNPNTAMLGVVANGKDASNYGVRIETSGNFQGSIYATNDVVIQNQSSFDGPVVANSFTLGNNVTTHEFPTVTTVPVGWPSNPTIYAEPQPPSSYSG